MSHPMIPFIDLKIQYQALKSQIQQRINDVLEHGQYIMGPEVRELEQRLEVYSGAKHCITCASGTEALLISLMALGVGPGDEVITTPFTFAATVEMIVLIGAAIPAGYLLLSHMPSASDPAHPKPAARDLTTGRIIIANEAGCRERGFNNYNGQSTEKGAILCNAVAPQSQGLTERLDTIRRAFGPR